MDSKPESPSAVLDKVIWDKEAPTGPPGQPIDRSLPRHLKKIEAFFEGVVADEGLLLDVALDRAMLIVERNCAKRRAGADFFNGQQPGPEAFAALATPLAVELYKQALVAVNDRKEEYTVLLTEAQREAANGRKDPPSIIVPE